MKNPQIKTAVVGLGRIGWGYHVPQIAKTDGFELAAVVDVSEERLAEAKAAYGAEGYTDLSQMLDMVSPELVVIASPTHLHKMHAAAAMEHGSDVFLDKPMAKDLSEAEEIAAVQARTGRKLMIYQPHRIVPEAQILKRIMESGILGPIYMLKRAVSGYARRNDWQSLQKYGGGMLNNYGAHFIDQALYLLNGKAQRVSCHMLRAASLGDADDVVKLLIGTDNQITVDIDINMATAHPITPWMLCGKYGTVVQTQNDEGEQVLRARYFDPDKLRELSLHEQLAAEGRKYAAEDPIPWQTLDFVIKEEKPVNFYDHCHAYYAQNLPPLVTVGETLHVMKTIERCRRDSGGIRSV